MQDHARCWYLAQFKPNSHNIALRNLGQQGFGTFLPLQKVTRRQRGTFVTRLVPLFPGYLFVLMDRRRESWAAVNSTHGVSRLVCLGKEPVPVPGALVGELRLRCDEAGEFQPLYTPQPGDAATLTVGPFADFVARVESIAPDRRVWVLMDLMGVQTRLQVAASHLRAH